MWISNDFDLARDGERRLQKDIRISAADRCTSMLKEQGDYSEQDLRRFISLLDRYRHAISTKHVKIRRDYSRRGYTLRTLQPMNNKSKYRHRKHRDKSNTNDYSTGDYCKDHQARLINNTQAVSGYCSSLKSKTIRIKESRASSN